MAPLDDLIILDFTRAVAGPFCTMMLADLGARVIKVEEPGRGDETRSWGPPFAAGTAAYFLTMNRNKESITADLKSEEDLRLIRAISARADVVIENFRPGVMDRLGIGYQALSTQNPRLVFASVSGFGSGGPDRGKPGYDMIIQALSGSMHSSAAPGEDAAKIAFPVSDIIASLFAGKAILAALYARHRTGRGRFVEVSLLEGMLCAQSNLAGSILLAGVDPPQVGVAQGNIVPYQLFHCRDAPIIAGALNERLWQRFCRAIDREEWTGDPRFCDNPSRMRNRTALVALIEEILRTQPAAHWIARFEQNEVPCGPVLSLREALALPQVAARGTIVEAEGSPLRMIASPMRMEGHQPRYRAPAALGEHTAAIRREFLGGATMP
jgi:formyl-CoA transferase/CoA:oxalate CoA-transferase